MFSPASTWTIAAIFVQGLASKILHFEKMPEGLPSLTSGVAESLHSDMATAIEDAKDTCGGTGKGTGKGKGKAIYVVEGWSDVEGYMLQDRVKIEEDGFWIWADNGLQSAEDIDGLVVVWFANDGGDGGSWKRSRAKKEWLPVRAAHDSSGFVWLEREKGEAGIRSGVGDVAAGHAKRECEIEK